MYQIDHKTFGKLSLYIYFMSLSMNEESQNMDNLEQNVISPRKYLAIRLSRKRKRKRKRKRRITLVALCFKVIAIMIIIRNRKTLIYINKWTTYIGFSNDSWLTWAIGNNLIPPSLLFYIGVDSRETKRCHVILLY